MAASNRFPGPQALRRWMIAEGLWSDLGGGIPRDCQRTRVLLLQVHSPDTVSSKSRKRKSAALVGR